MTNTLTISRELAAQWLVDLEGCTAFVVAEQLRALLAAPQCWPCWSCRAPVTMANRADADGNCPHCEAELDLEDWPIREPSVELLQAQATIAQQAQRIAAPVVERQPEPVARVRHSPIKRHVSIDILKCGLEHGQLLFASPPAPVAVPHTMKSVMSAICAINGFPMLTSNQCHALAQSLNAIACLDKVKEMNP